MNNILELAGVTKTYRLGASEVHALRSINLNIRNGELLSIVGPSGSGKSSLLHIAGCVDQPTAGEVRLNGKSIAGLTDKELTALRRESIGFVFQQFYLIPTLTVLENVLLPTLFHGGDKENHAKELLDGVGLKDRFHHRVSQLSGGEMQRAAIARALINNPRFLLADEPTGNLDSENAQIIFEIFRKLKSSGVAVAVVTHNLELAQRADRMLKLRDGQIIAD